jgi:hypothetical protein
MLSRRQPNKHLAVELAWQGLGIMGNQVSVCGIGHIETGGTSIRIGRTGAQSRRGSSGRRIPPQSGLTARSADETSESSPSPRWRCFDRQIWLARWSEGLAANCAAAFASGWLLAFATDKRGRMGVPLNRDAALGTNRCALRRVRGRALRTPSRSGQSPTDTIRLFSRGGRSVGVGII